MASAAKEKRKAEKKKTYTLRRLSDGKVLRKRLSESFMIHNLDCLRRITIDGVEYQRLVEDEFPKGDKNLGRMKATWPMKSDSLGVHPAQIPEASAYLRSIGIPTDYTPDGRAILTGPKHRRKLAEASNLYDRNGGYSDPQFRPYDKTSGHISEEVRAMETDPWRAAAEAIVDSLLE